MSQRSRRSLFQISAVTLGSLACLLACGGGSSSDDGTLLVRTAAQANGVNFRLNSATFQVTGAETVTLSTSDPPSPTPLQAQLPPGQYSVELDDGWVLEQQTGTTFEAVSGATLTSMNPQSVSVVRAQIASVGFVFDAAGVAVDFAQVPSGGDDDYTD